MDRVGSGDADGLSRGIGGVVGLGGWRVEWRAGTGGGGDGHGQGMGTKWRWAVWTGCRTGSGEASGVRPPFEVSSELAFTLHCNFQKCDTISQR